MSVTVFYFNNLSSACFNDLLGFKSSVKVIPFGMCLTLSSIFEMASTVLSARITVVLLAKFFLICYTYLTLFMTIASETSLFATSLSTPGIFSIFGLLTGIFSSSSMKNPPLLSTADI